jgi:hypothetical protein
MEFLEIPGEGNVINSSAFYPNEHMHGSRSLFTAAVVKFNESPLKVKHLFVFLKSCFALQNAQRVEKFRVLVVCEYREVVALTFILAHRNLNGTKREKGRFLIGKLDGMFAFERRAAQFFSSSREKIGLSTTTDQSF